ncbi:MAG: amino acid permease [Planctomycetota bacterium]
MQGKATASTGLGHRVGLFGATMVGVGAMVGAGIFVLAGVAIEHAGPGAIIAFVLCGIITTITAFSWAELAAAFPEAGGGYVFAKKVFPIGTAFAAGWVLWFAYVVACALYALGFAGFLVYTVEAVSSGLMDRIYPWQHSDVVIAALAVIVSAALIAWRGPGAGNWISAAKVIAFLILIGAGALVLLGRPAGTVETSFTPMLPHGFTGILAAMGFVFIALEGYEIIAAVSEEVKDPARTIPRAMFLSIGVTMVVYLGLLFVILTVGGPADGTIAWRDLGEQGSTAVAVAAQRFGGSLGTIVVLAAGLLATFSALVATLLAASRVSFAMARDRVLPRALSRTRGRAGTPVVALALCVGLVVAVIAVTADVNVAGAAASLIFLLSFGLANTAGLLVRARVGARAGFQAPLYPLLPLVGIVACLGLAIFGIALEPVASLVILTWLGLGGILYAAAFRKSAITVSARTEAFDADLIRLRGRAPLVLVPVANPLRAEPLVRLAEALVTPGVGRTMVLAVARYRPQEMPQSGLAAYGRAEHAVARAVAAACELGRAFEGVVLLATDVTDAIAGIATERRPETILLGMSSLSEASGTALLDRIIARTTSDVVVLKAPPEWSLDAVRKILIPVAGETPHDPLRARMLGTMLQDENRSAALLRVLSPGGDVERAERHLLVQADDLGLQAESCIVEESKDPVGTIVHYSESADLIVLGLGRHRLIGKFARAVVEGASCPVIAIAQALRSRLGSRGLE